MTAMLHVDTSPYSHCNEDQATVYAYIHIPYMSTLKLYLKFNRSPQQILWDTIPYTVKLLSGKTFAVRIQNCHLQENFHASMLVDLHCQSTRP